MHCIVWHFIRVYDCPQCLDNIIKKSQSKIIQCPRNSAVVCRKVSTKRRCSSFQPKMQSELDS